MQKTRNLLLTLSAEERKAAQAFVKRRLKTLAYDRIQELRALSQMSKRVVRQFQLEKSRYARSPSRAGKLMAKLYDVALVDIQDLIREFDQTVYTLQHHHKEQEDRANGEDEGKTRDTEEDLIVTCSAEETEHATQVIKDRLENMRLSDIKRFRDACQNVLTWWESERGQLESLHMDQVGNVNTSKGRVAIRQKRGEMQRAVFNPFKMFYRQLNTDFQRRSNQAMQAAKTQGEQEGG